MGWFDWIEDMIPKGLSVDQEVPQTPVLPQQEPLTPKTWLAQQNAQQAEQQIKEQQQQEARSQTSVDMYTPEVTTPQVAQTENRVLSPKEWLAQQPKAQETPFQLADTTNLLYKGVKALAEPASSALEAISYLDKPRGAIAGAVKAYQDDVPLVDGAKKGWDENTSWKETFNPEWVKENPKTAAVAGLAADIVADPLWVITPAKIASGVKQVSKMTGLTDNVVTPVANAFKGTETGRKTIDFVEDTLGINNPLQSANEVYNATKASLSSEVKQVLNYVEEVFGKELKGVNRADAESYMQRMVEAYPDIGRFARAGDEVKARDATIEALQNEIAKAKSGLSTAQDSVSKVGQLSDEERKIAEILNFNKINPNQIEDAVKTAQGMDTIYEPARKMAGAMPDNNVRIKKAAVDLILAGKMPESELPKLLGIFSKEEIASLLPDLERKFKNSKALEEIKKGMVNPAIVPAKPASLLERQGLETAGKVDNVIDDIPVDLNAGLKPVDIVAKPPNLMDDVQRKLDGKGVLPSVKITGKTKESVKLSNIDEDGRRLIANIKNVPELASKINSEQELQRQLKAVERAREALQKADISPEKTTQVFEAASKAGYTPAQVEGMFKASEKMREVNQIFTNEASKRRLIPDENAAAFGGGRHLRRMYTALENPEQHYNNLLALGNKELADKFWSAYSKLEGGLKAKGISLNMATFEARKNLPKEIQDQLGKLYEATYPFAKGNKIAAEQYAKYDFLKEVARLHGSDTMQKGMKKVPITDTNKFGQLEGKFLPERVYQNVLFSVAKHDQEVTAWQKGVQRWKALKLINPASVNRNMLSGSVMANIFGDIPLHKMPKIIYDTFIDMKQGTTRWLEARNAGAFETNITKGEIESIANRTRGQGSSFIDKVDNKLQKGMEIYSIPDNFWRLAVINHARDTGKTLEEGVRLANQALFDYSNAPRWVEYLARTGIVPFAKFPFFAAKATAKAAWEKPAEITKYLKPQNQVNTEDREKIMPEYTKARTLLPIGDGTRIVNGKEQKVQNNIDLSYILPFANDMKLGNPLTDAVIMSRTGQNGLGQRVIKPGMTDSEKSKVWKNFAINSLGPSFPIPMPDGSPIPSNYAGQKLKDAWNGTVDSKGRQYDLPSAVAQTLLGVKNVPVNTQEMFNAKMSSLAMEQRNVTAMINEIKKSKLPQSQKDEQLADHKSQQKELARQMKETSDAWKRIKKKEGS